VVGQSLGAPSSCPKQLQESDMTSDFAYVADDPQSQSLCLPDSTHETPTNSEWRIWDLQGKLNFW
jgi:hypothetical protein